MPYNIRIVSTYPPRRCGIGTFSRDLATALEHLTAEIGHIRIAAIDNGNGPYGIPVDLVIDQYNPESWADTTEHIITRAGEGTKVIFTGDIQQIDHPYLDSLSNGLSYLINRMVGQSIYAHVTLEKGERSPLADLASNLL